MTDTTYARNIQLKPSFAGLMNLYGNNYRLLATLMECLSNDENLLQDKKGYTLKIRQGRRSRYTQTVDLHYSLHTKKRKRKTIVAIASFKVRLYLDTCQAEVICDAVELREPLLMRGLFLSLRKKWYYNQCLRIILRSFFTS